MTSEYQRVRRLVSDLRLAGDPENWRKRLAPAQSPPPPAIRHAKRINQHQRRVMHRWKILRNHTAVSADDQELLSDAGRAAAGDCYERDIENFIGTVQLPVTVA